jgi:putative CocE/NonD family hydrolase
MLKRIKQLSLALGALLVLAIAGLLMAGSMVTLTGEELTPSGHRRNESFYVTMRDDVKIAVDVYYPPTLAEGEKVPTLIRATRYGRAQNIGFGIRVRMALGLMKSRDPNLRPDTIVLNDAGYAVVRVDARGSGASFGHRPIEWSADEVADYGEVIEWITRQPWSNGRVGAYGVSYDGNASEVIASTGHPALKAVAPMWSYFDPFQDLIRPGGVFDSMFISSWSEGTHSMDERLPCQRGFARCLREKVFSDGIKPVDSDSDGELRAAAAADRNNAIVLDSFSTVEFRDDNYGVFGAPFDTRAPFRLAEQIEASGVAMNVWAGWYDSAAVDGALKRYATLSNPQQVIIGPLTHGGKHDSNPFAPAQQPVQPDMDEQYRMLARFFDPLLKEGKPPASVTREVRYYTLGENAWKTTAEWPPRGAAMKRWFFAGAGELRPEAPSEAQASDEYRVDLGATTGKTSRWHTIGGPDVLYPGREAADSKLLTYTSAPLTSDVEITGNATVTLQLAASTTDAALHVYLEDVAPDGTVTYLTEGVLRAMNRRVSDEPPPYPLAPPSHSLLRADAEPLTPGVASEIPIGLYAISALVKQGHRIRIAIAGANVDVFSPVASDTDVVFTVHRSAALVSYVDLPIVAAEGTT